MLMPTKFIMYQCGCCQPEGYTICPNPECKDPKPPKEPWKIVKMKEAKEISRI